MRFEHPGGFGPTDSIGSVVSIMFSLVTTRWRSHMIRTRVRPPHEVTTRVHSHH